DEDGILYAVLGGDDTGGIVWSPKVLQQAALTGLYLRADNTLLDTEARDEITDDSKLIGPMSEKDIAELRLYTDVELRGRMVTQDDLVWSDRALLDSVLPGHASELAPVIGWGMTMDRNHVPPITNPHTFSLEWLRTPAGNAVGFHRHHDTQVLMSVEGEWQITFNRGDDQITPTISTETFVSIPRGVWRSFANVGEADALMLVVNGTDNRNLIGWDDSIVSAAEAAGWAVDASGYLAAGRVLTRQAR
ncbi:MAG: cupin domain-containing protein, partial [Acidimicrobiia bacterium]